MSNTPSDTGLVTQEQAMKAAELLAVAKLAQDIVRIIHSQSGTSFPIQVMDHQGWKVEWRSEPTPRIQVRTIVPKLLYAVRDVLEALGYEVRDKGDHLVVIL